MLVRFLYRAHEGRYALFAQRIQCLIQRLLLRIEGILPHGGVVVLVHYLEQPTALAILVNIDLDGHITFAVGLAQVRLSGCKIFIHGYGLAVVLPNCDNLRPGGQ